MQLTDRVRNVTAPGQPRAPGAVGLLVAAAALALGGGPVGLAVGSVLVLVGLAASATATFALGQAALLAVRPGLLPLVVAEAGLFLVLLASMARTGATTSDRSAGPIVVLAAVLFAVLGTTAWIGAARLGIVPATVGLVVAAALASYLLHRYERVVLGLAGGEEA